MCGIAGIQGSVEIEAGRQALGQMLRGIGHRGPDARGRHDAEGIHLGHVRLAILDLTDRAAQPMASYRGRYHLSFNGEIYNFRELRERLRERHIEIDSSGDTRVLLEHLVLFGLEETLPLLEGFFAFALWDEKQRSLSLARDRHGIKPLYYRADKPNQFRFASEIKALILDGAAPDPAGTDACLLGLGCTFGEHTLFREVKSVLPGESLTVQGGQITARSRFFDLADFVAASTFEEADGLSDDEVLARAEEAFTTSLDYRMISDAPLACMVSGGLDSNLIAKMASDRLDGLELYHADVRFNSERGSAEELARHLGLELHVVEMDERCFLEHVPEVTHSNDLPLIYHRNSVPFYLLSRLASQQGIKVVLTGEGSDEYFLGYPQIVLEPLLSLLEGMRSGLRRVMRGVSSRATDLIWRSPEGTPSAQLRRLVMREEPALGREMARERYAFIPQSRKREMSARSLALVLDHLGTLLHRNDRLGMAWGLESRFPFLGHDLARLALNVPPRFKVRRTWRLYDRRHPFVIDKWLVREIARRQGLPAHLVRRPKKGFPIPIERCIDVRPSLFHGGFVEDWYRLGRRELELHLNRVTPMWRARLMFLDVWGRMFFGGESSERVRAGLLGNVGVRPE